MGKGDRLLKYGSWVAVVCLLICILTLLPVCFMSSGTYRTYIKGDFFYWTTGTFGWGLIIGGIMTVLRSYRWMRKKLYGE